MTTRMLIVSAALAGMSALGGVKDEVHGYTPKGYVQPKEPEVRDYGKVDIIAEARKYNPALIAVDRTAGGTCENVITPEQTVPKTPIAVPWESCITIGRYWGYHFEDEYKPVRQILLVSGPGRRRNLPEHDPVNAHAVRG